MRSSRKTALVVVVLAFVLIATTGCSGGGDADPKALMGTEWELVEAAQDSDALASAGITANFDGERLAGFGGVNHYGSSYTAKANGDIEISESFGTKSDGSPEFTKAEETYLKILPTIDGYSVEGDTLKLLIDGEAALTFTSAASMTLPGTSWNVASFNSGANGVATVAEGSQLTLTFDDKSTVSGSGGINEFSGAYTAAKDTVKLGPLTLTEKGGPEELMLQEEAYVKALEASAKWEISRGRLEMKSADGSVQVVAAPVRK